MRRILRKTEYDVVFLTGFYLILSFRILRRAGDDSVCEKICQVAAHLLICYADHEFHAILHRDGQSFLAAERRKARKQPVTVCLLL